MPAVSWSMMARKRMSLSRMAASARWRSCEARLSASPPSVTSRRLVATGAAARPAAGGAGGRGARGVRGAPPSPPPGGAAHRGREEEDRVEQALPLPFVHRAGERGGRDLDRRGPAVVEMRERDEAAGLGL